MKKFCCILLLALVCQASASGLFKVPEVIGDPAKMKLSVVQYQQIKDGFHYPSPTLQQIVSEYYDISQQKFVSLPLDSQIRIILKICDTLGVQKDNRLPFLLMHYSYRIPKQTMEKMLDVYKN